MTSCPLDLFDFGVGFYDLEDFFYGLIIGGASSEPMKKHMAVVAEIHF